jgi:hypothetical protein
MNTRHGTASGVVFSPSFVGVVLYPLDSIQKDIALAVTVECPPFGAFVRTDTPSQQGYLFRRSGSSFFSSCRTLIFGVEDRSGVGHRPSYLDSHADNACAHMSHRGCYGDVVVWLCRRRRRRRSLSCHSLAVKLGLLRPLCSRFWTKECDARTTAYLLTYHPTDAGSLEAIRRILTGKQSIFLASSFPRNMGREK